MQSAAAFTAAPTLPLLKPRRLSANHGPGHVVLCSKRHDSNVVPPSPSAFPPIRRSWSLSSTPSSMFRPWTAVPLRDPDTTGRSQATAVPESAGGEEHQTTELARKIEVLLLMGLWYFFNIIFNIYNKQVRFLTNFFIFVFQFLRFIFKLLVVLRFGKRNYLEFGE